MFVGQHDYTHFASQGNPDPISIKTIHRFDVLQDTDGFVFQVEGSGFMYKMVCLSILPAFFPVYPHFAAGNLLALGKACIYIIIMQVHASFLERILRCNF